MTERRDGARACQSASGHRGGLCVIIPRVVSNGGGRGVDLSRLTFGWDERGTQVFTKKGEDEPSRRSRLLGCRGGGAGDRTETDQK